MAVGPRCGDAHTATPCRREDEATVSSLSGHITAVPLGQDACRLARSWWRATPHKAASPIGHAKAIPATGIMW
ncbi:hypothetical protein [Thermosporothrix hazakensis]|uniref:hypothetical protein n=1 Tax=Thermosporothrix hazakensis TaxID=644383 RepID=UPI0010F90C4C|nr:hypothetical protein [Thermosporothrix hazakensis]